MRVTRRKGALGAAALLGAIAVWQLGAGGYIQAKALLAQYLLRTAWAETVGGAGKVRPWPWADTWPVARLRAPEHEVDLIVLAGASGRTLAFGPGHLDGTPQPGQAGNAVLAGHRDTSFRFIRWLAPGDRLVVQRPTGARVTYRVVNAQIVDSRKQWVLPETDRRRLTLVTCYPFDSVVPGGPLRYVVTAEDEA